MTPLPDIIDVPLDDILSFAHADLPDDFEGLFFKNKTKAPGLESLEWEETIVKDPRYYLPVPSPEKISCQAGLMEKPNLSYILMYAHKGIHEIIGLYSAHYLRFAWEGRRASGDFVSGSEDGWGLGIITDIRRTAAYARLGFINAGAKVLLNAFYQAGMRRVHTMTDKSNYRSIAFDKWLGFSDPILLSRIIPMANETLAQTVQHYYFKSGLKDIIDQIQGRQNQRSMRTCSDYIRHNVQGQYDRFRRVQHEKRQNEILMTVQKIRESICQK